MFLIVIAIAGMVFGKQAAEGEILGRLGGVLGEAAANAIQEMVNNAARPEAGLIAATVGMITFLFGTAGVLIELKDALDTIWKVEPKKSTGTLSIVKKGFLRSPWCSAWALFLSCCSSLTLRLPR